VHSRILPATFWGGEDPEPGPAFGAEPGDENSGGQQTKSTRRGYQPRPTLPGSRTEDVFGLLKALVHLSDMDI